MPKRADVAFRVPLTHARALWHRSQGLRSPLEGGLHDLIARTGWLRTLGGVDVYLAIRARRPAITRAAVDADALANEIAVRPAARGCIYLLPRAHNALALRVAAELTRKRTALENERAGIRPGESEAIGEAALAALSAGPASPDVLRKRLPEGMVRSLGETGKKIGLSSPLPGALRELEFEGRIERTLPDGRMDSERYLWRIAARAPERAPDDPVTRNAALIRIFLSQAAPASAREIAAWTGLTDRDVRAALATLPLTPVAIEGHAEESWVPDTELTALREGLPPGSGIRFIAFEDNYLTTHDGPGPMVDPSLHALQLPNWGSAGTQELGKSKHLSMRAVLDGDRVVGLWEYDAAAGEVVTHTFAPLPLARADELQEQRAALARFIEQELGHARSFSLDTDKGVAERARLIRAMTTLG